MKLTHLLVAGTAFVSASALAAGDQKDKDTQAQSSQTQSQQGAQSSTGASASQHMDKETIRQVQQKLSEKGHDVQADGIMGPKTQQALREFQEKNQLQASGELDQETLAELGVESGSSSMGASSPSSSQGSSSQGASSGSASQSDPGKKSQ